MNWKRIGRFLFCLVMVCVILINCSPIRAEAVVGEALILTACAVTSGIAVSALLMGMGILPGIDNWYFHQLVDDCKDYLREKAFLNANDEVDMYLCVGDDIGQYMISQELAEAVREWMFDSGACYPVSSGITGTSLFYGSYYYLWQYLRDCEYPFFDQLHQAYLENKFLALAMNHVHIYGFYFGSKSGRLYTGRFPNPYNVANAAYCGLYDLAELEIEIYDSLTPLWFGSIEDAQAYSSYLTSDIYVIDWDTAGSKIEKSFTGTTFEMPGFHKSSSASVFGATSETGLFKYSKDSSADFGRLKKLYVLSGFSGGSSSVSVSDGLTAGTIAGQDKTFEEGYSTWASGAKSLPTLRNGVMTDAESAYIALGMGKTMEETLKMTQAEIQAGTGTYEGTGSGTASDTVTASGLKGWLDTLRMTLVSGFSQMVENIQANTDSIISPLSEILNGVLLIPEAIISGVTSALQSIFVPKEDFLTEKVSALRAEFSFADTLITGGQMIGDAFNGFDTEPPIIYIDLGATRGEYDIGGKVPFIDLTWYEEYKPTVDMLLSSLLWVVFIWKLFQKAPGIISGMPGDFVMDGLQYIGLDDRLPSRKAGYEVQRLSNREMIRKGRK